MTETTKDIDGNDVTVSYKVNGGEAAEGDAADFTIEDGKTTTVDFEDDYTKQTGILELTKTILGDITEEEAEGTLTFVITTKVTEGGNEVTKYLKADGTLSDTEAALTLKDFDHEEETDKYTLTITTSELGSYTVTETTMAATPLPRPRRTSTERMSQSSTASTEATGLKEQRLLQPSKPERPQRSPSKMTTPTSPNRRRATSNW